MKQIRFLVFCLFLMFPPLLHAKEITIDNWKTHATIKQILEMRAEIINGVETGKYHKWEQRSKPNCTDKWCLVYGIEIKLLGENGRSRLRSCEWTYERDDRDGTVETKVYFDQTGLLRYIIKFLPRRHGTEYVNHMFFNKSRKMIWSIQRDRDTDEIIGWRVTNEIHNREDCQSYKKRFSE